MNEPSHREEAIFEAALGLSSRLRNAWLDQEIARLSVQVSMPELSDEERLPMLERLQELRLAKRAPLTARVGPGEA